MSKGNGLANPRSETHEVQPGGLDDKVDAFEDQVTGGVLDHAGALDSSGYALREHSGLAILTLTLPYFEQIAGYLRGEDGRSFEFFVDGLVEVLPDLEPDLARSGVRDPQAALFRVARILYDEAHGGLFHEAIVRGHVVLRRDTAPLGVVLDGRTAEIACVAVDPFRLLDAVRTHLERYVQRLRDPGQAALRQSFERLWDQRMSTSTVVPPSPAAAVSAPGPVPAPAAVSDPVPASPPAPIPSGVSSAPVVRRLVTLIRSRW